MLQVMHCIGGQREIDREIYARGLCIVRQREVAGRNPWCKDHTEPLLLVDGRAVTGCTLDRHNLRCFSIPFGREEIPLPTGG